MKTSTLRATALSLALGGCALSPVYAGETPDPPGAGSKQADLGAVTGLAVGAVAAGPVGAVVGAAAGALLGDRYHRQAQSRAALATDLEHSETQRAELAASVAQLDGSLGEARANGAALAAQLSRTDQLGLDVSFRTDDDAVAAQAMSPLLKLGALAASMPATSCQPAPGPSTGSASACPSRSRSTRRPARGRSTPTTSARWPAPSTPSGCAGSRPRRTRSPCPSRPRSRARPGSPGTFP